METWTFANLSTIKHSGSPDRNLAAKVQSRGLLWSRLGLKVSTRIRRRQGCLNRAEHHLQSPRAPILNYRIDLALGTIMQAVFLARRSTLARPGQAPLTTHPCGAILLLRSVSSNSRGVHRGKCLKKPFSSTECPTRTLT